MQVPTAISFRGLAASEALRSEVIEHVQRAVCRLEDILACRVLIEIDDRQARRAGLYGAHVRIALPCVEIEGGTDAPHRLDPRLALADAFAELSTRMDRFIDDRCRSCRRFGRSMVR